MDSLTRNAPIPHLQEMKAAYGILPHIILKVAVSLFSMARMGTNAALFANAEAGRSLLFVSDWLTSGEALQNPLSIAGPFFFMLLSV
jgi:hypothetical protein